jgi:hypothetical protein
MTNIVDTYAAKIEKQYDPAAFLGHLCWYGIPEAVNVTHDEFTALCDSASIPFPKLPKPRIVDVFKRACKNAVVNKYVPDDTERATLAGDVHHINYMIRGAGADETHVWRVIVKEVVDSAGHKLSYDDIAVVQFGRQGNLSVRWKTNDVWPVERGIESNIMSYYTSQAVTVTPYAIREFVRKGIEWYLHAIRVRPSGGVYFIQEQFSPTMKSLEKVVNDVGGSFHTLPLLDDSKQREMLRQAFEDEAMGDVEEMMVEISALMSNKKNISSDKYVDFFERYNKQRKKVVEYSDLLDEAMEKTGSALEILSTQMEALKDLVEV